MKQVLIVEDEALIRRGIVEAVDWSALGFQVAGEAANGLEGLAAAKELDPDLIVTDLKMPQMDGMEMIRQLKSQGSRARVIILTAYDTFTYAQQALRLGAADYLVKPFHDGDLEQAVLRLYSREQQEDDLLLSEMRQNRLSRYVLEAMNYIDQNYRDPDLGLGDLARHLGISEGYLSHIFKRETGHTILSYMTRRRIYEARLLLSSCRIRVYEVAQKVGYRDIAYFSNTFKKYTGCSPSDFQSKENI